MAIPSSGRPAPPAPSRPQPQNQGPSKGQNQGPKPPPAQSASAIGAIGDAKMPSEDHENFTPGIYLVRTRRFKHFMSARNKGEIVVHESEIVHVHEEYEGSRRKGQVQGVTFMLNRNEYAIGELRQCIGAHYPEDDTSAWVADQWVQATFAAVKAPENNTEQPLTGQYVWAQAAWAQSNKPAEPGAKPFCRVRYSYASDEDLATLGLA